jgi:phospholipid transport system transporter-binding protein
VSSDAIVHLELPETLTFATARAWVGLTEVRLRTTPGAQVSVDARALRQFDTAALAALLACARAVRERGGTLTLEQGPAGLISLASLYGVSSVLGMPTFPNPGVAAAVHLE